jgi:CheY-like chemotaxis protein
MLGEGSPPPASEPDASEIAALRAALAVERLKGEAFAELRRELRALIASVVGVTGLLLDTQLTPEQRDHVKRVRGFSEALAGLVDGALDPGRVEAGKLEPAAAAPAEERPRVLLVEDNAVNQRVAKVMMERRGYRVDVASDGNEAVEATGREAYAAVLMDCHMPRLDGYAATRAIRARAARAARAVLGAAPPHLPIIAMTADAGAGARERCLAEGMDDYVAKPVTADVLDTVLRRWVPRATPAARQPTTPPATPRPTATRRPSSPAVNLGMLRQMRTTQGPGEPDIVAEVVALFLQDAPARVTALRDAAASGDLATAARTAHTLKGSAGHLGAKTLAGLCTRFEEKVRAGAPFSVAFAVDAITEEFERVRDALAAEGPGRGAPPSTPKGGAP